MDRAELPPSQTGGTIRYERLVVLILLMAAVYRCLFVAVFPRGPDECMYHHWSQRLDIGYVDHPPLVAYVIAGMDAVLGDQVWSPRLLAVILASATGWLLFCTGRLLLDERVGFWAATLHAACPFLSMGGGIMLLPESLLQFWITLGLWISARLVTTGRTSLFYPLGLVFGCALLTKYPAAVLPGGLALFAICSREHRQWFARRGPYLFVLIGLVMFVPVIIWNVRHDWIGLQFISHRTHAAGGAPGVAGIWHSLTGQAAYHSPITFALLLFGVIVAGYRGFVRRDRSMLLLFCFSGPWIACFLIIAARRDTLPHWPAAAYFAAYIAAPAALLIRNSDTETARAGWRHRVLTAAACVGAVLCALLPILLVYPLTTIAYRKLEPVLGLPPKVIEPMAAAYGWKTEIRDRVLQLRDRVRAAFGADPVVLTHYHLTAASLHDALGDEIKVVSLGPEAFQYGVWYDASDVDDRPVIYVSTDNNDSSRGSPEDFYVFDQCEPQPDLAIIRSDVKINEAKFWLCTGYQGLAERD